MSDLRKAAQMALDAWDNPMGMKDLCVAMDAIRTALEQQAEPVHGDIRALKYRIHELEGEVIGYKRMLDVAEAASQPQQQAEPSQWRDMVVVSLVREGVNKHKARELADHFATLPQQKAEPVGFEMAQPVAWRFKDPKDGHWLYTTHLVDLSKKYWRLKNELFDPLYTAPPQRKPLTDELEAAFKDGWQSAKAAHGIKEGT